MREGPWVLTNCVPINLLCVVLVRRESKMMDAGTDYAQRLLEVIMAPGVRAKAELLESLPMVEEGWSWQVPALPQRPGREAEVREGRPPRRRRGLHHALARAQFLHAIWHIECSAIDLAITCSLHGPVMPPAFHHQHIQVAREEAEHARMVAELLQAMGRPPGHDPVHHRLWDAALACRDLGDHLVVIPRFLEARGLDVNADVLPRLRDHDAAAHAVLERIYLDELGHVGIGTHWHRVWCDERRIDPEQHFHAVLQHHGLLRFPHPAPLDYAGRRRVGFSEQELIGLDPVQYRAVHAKGPAV
ncbi:MAG: DUF455 family protein [Planctomycetota bacterium]|nr:MAG: DUF455 family protein [Planctomycetota bacterium]